MKPKKVEAVVHPAYPAVCSNRHFRLIPALCNHTRLLKAINGNYAVRAESKAAGRPFVIR